jgi:hypothetical protein
MVNFELDGASVHGNRRQREIDLRRDALLATLGVLVVRFTHHRLVYETASAGDPRDSRSATRDRRHHCRPACLIQVSFPVLPSACRTGNANSIMAGVG